MLGTLALCIGANAAICSIIDTLFFRPLPYVAPNRLVLISTLYRKGGLSELQTNQTGRTWELVRDHATLLDSVVFGQSGVNLFTRGRVEFVQQARVSANYFKVLGIPPFLGRE